MKIPITLDKTSPVILIDTSYFIFYRYFSSIKWYQFQNKEIDYDDIHNDEAFMKALEKHTLADIKKLCKTWKTKFSNIIFCCDCYREDIWRNHLTTGYKAARVVNAKFNQYIFQKFYEYLETNKTDWGISILAVDKLEADDVAYLSKRTLQSKYWEQPIVIITNDNDYLQTLDNQTHIYNMTGKGNDISKRSCGNPLIDLNIKIIQGDKSDNIKPIHTGMTTKLATALASDPVALEEYLLEKNCRAAYENNRKLIDFTMIPEEYVNAFETKYDWDFY